MTDLEISDLDLTLDGLDIDLDDFDGVDSVTNKCDRYLKPKKHIVNVSKIKYENAEKMAVELGDCSERTFALISGSFIFGDLIEAIIVKNNWHVKRLVISTLSLSIANIESLRNLIVGNYVDKLDLVVSDYFYSKDIYDRLDVDDKFQITVANTHTKIVTIETHCGNDIIIHGPANLRSSGCTEHICVENDKSIVDFYIKELIEPNIKHFQQFANQKEAEVFVKG